MTESRRTKYPWTKYPRLGLCAALAWLSVAATSPAAPSETEYVALATLRGQGGFPVRATPDGLLQTQRFNQQCDLLANNYGIFDHALAGPVGGELTLELTVMGCPRPEPPDVNCSWAIEETPLEGDAVISGGEGRISVSLPATTGAYRLRVDCTAPTPATWVGDPIVRYLFVTLGNPRLPPRDMPPRPQWYLTACSWGGGFGRADDENRVVRAMMDKLYHHGQIYWRYGSFDDSGFSGTLNYRPCCAGGWCSCPWQELVTQKTSCNFANCTQFVGLLEAMARVLGMAGFTPVTIYGSFDKGLATAPEDRSLDPRFVTNVNCVGPECPRYVFSNHVILKKSGGPYFDPTFNRIRTSPEEVIYMNVARIHDSLKVLKPVEPGRSETKVCALRRGYGSWLDYSDLFHGAATNCPPETRAGALGPAATGTMASVSFRRGEIGPDGTAQVFVAILDAGVQRAGPYFVEAYLRKGNRVVATSPMPGGASYSHVGFNDAGGSQRTRVELAFSGEQIRQSGIDGPYKLEAYLAGPEGTVLAELSIDTPGWSHRAFGPLAALSNPRVAGAPDRRGGKLLGLLARFDADVPVSGSYEILARLGKGGQAIVYAHHRVDVTAGERPYPLEILLPGERIAASGLDSPYHLSLELAAMDDVADSCRRTQPFLETTVKGFKASDFASRDLGEAEPRKP